MHFIITLEWNETCGILLNEMYPFREGIEEYFKERNYGSSLTRVRIILNILGYDVKQRRRFKKNLQELDYDIILDYFLIKNVRKEEKKTLIKKQFLEITEQTLSKYKFEDFDKNAFLKDLRSIVNTVTW